MINQSVTIQPWKSGGPHNNDSVWSALIGAGWTPRQIAKLHLVKKVAQMNHLKDPNLVHPGLKLVVPSPQGPRQEFSPSEEGKTPEKEPGPGSSHSGGIFGPVVRIIEGIKKALGW